MQVNSFLHTAILVTDLARSERFYSGVLGLSRVDRNLRSPGAWYQVGEFQIHLILASAYPDDRVDGERWGRNRHLAFAITSLPVAKEYLLNHGCPFQMSASGRPALFTEDPDGNIIELGEV